METLMHFYPTDVDVAATETVYISCTKRPYGFVFEKKKPRYCTIALMVAGKARYELDQEAFTAEAGDVLFIPAHISYTVRAISEEPWENYAIGFRTAENIANLPLDRVQKVSDPAHFAELFGKAYRVWGACGFGYRIQIKAMLHQILYELLQESFDRHYASNAALSSLRIAADYMEKNYREHITVETLAELSGYSASHFSRQFSRVYGTSPIQYLNSVRVLHAKNLLSTDQYSMAEIAQKCGFSNVYYFSRCFKQLTGTTPGKW